MEAVVLEAFVRQALEVRRLTRTAECRGGAKASVVDQDHEHVRRACGRPKRLDRRERRSGILGVVGRDADVLRALRDADQIARPSRHEEPVIEHVREWADRHGFELAQDAGRNLVDPRAGEPGPRERRRPSCSRGTWTWCASAILRARTTRPKAGSSLVRDGEWLTADGTTLGADDGVAIAAMMALVEDESLPHGPLELLMTVAEEVGLEGANALDPVARHGLDPAQPRQRGGRQAHGRAAPGSTDTWIRVEAPREACSPGRGDAARCAASGGLGGHSGVKIALGRSNAIKVLGRALREAVRRPCRSGSSRWTAARAATRSPATPMAVCSVPRRPARGAFRDARATARPPRSATHTRRRTPGSRP